jgi:ankyrin repeat protein
LAELGADVNRPTKGGVTPLIIAAFKGHESVVIALLAAGADRKAALPNGHTALSAAMAKGHSAIAALLSKA